jgi:hypothetical protein
LTTIEEDFIHECSWAKLTNSTCDGTTIRKYYCSTAGRLVFPLRLKFVPDPASIKVSIFISNNEHDHPEPKHGLSNQTKELIRECYFYEKVTPPLFIQKRIFEKKVLSLPKVTQIKTYIQSLKNELIENIATLGELYEWCSLNKNQPEDNSRMFCPVHKIERDGATITSLQLFLTTYDLISQVSEDGKNLKKKFIHI